MNDEEAKLRILINTVFDERAAKMAADSLKKIKDEAKGTSGELNKTNEQFGRMGKSTGDLLSNIAKVGVVLTAAVAPINAAAKSYVNSVGMAESTSRQWLESNYRIEQSYERIGRVAAEKLAPIKKIQADLMEGLASLTENKPGLVGGGTAAIGGVGALGGIALLGKIIKGGGIASLFGGTAAGGATATAAAGATGATAGGVGSGVGAIVTIGGYIVAATAALLTLAGFISGLIEIIKDPEAFRQQTAENAEDTQQESIGKGGWIPGTKLADILGNGLNIGNAKRGYSEDPNAVQGVAPSYVADSTASKEKTWLEQVVENVEDFIKRLTQADDELGDEFVPTATLAKMRQYDIQERYAEEDFARQRFVANRDFNRQMAYSETDFYRQRSYTLRDFNISMAFTEKMFYLQRQIAQRDFNISLARNEYDYLLNRKRAAEDHNFSLKQIMLSGDALSYYYAQRQYNIDRQRQEEDYQRQRGRSVEDFNRQQTDSLMFFNLQRAQQVKQFEISLADQQREFEIQRARSYEQFNIQLKDVDYQYRKERTRRWEAFTEQILPEILTEAEYRAKIQDQLTTTMIDRFNELMYAFAEGWAGFMEGINQATGRAYGSSLPPKYADGGYTGMGGMAVLHPNEFVLSAGTTKQAEQVAQGTLSQDKIVSLLTSSGGGFIYNDSRQFARGLSAEEKAQIRRETKAIVMELFR